MYYFYRFLQYFYSILWCSQPARPRDAVCVCVYMQRRRRRRRRPWHRAENSRWAQS